MADVQELFPICQGQPWDSEMERRSVWLGLQSQPLLRGKAAGCQLDCPVSFLKVKILCDIKQMQEKVKKKKKKVAVCWAMWNLGERFLGTAGFPHSCFSYQRMYEWVPLCHM